MYTSMLFISAHMWADIGQSEKNGITWKMKLVNPVQILSEVAGAHYAVWEKA